MIRTGTFFVTLLFLVALNGGCGSKTGDETNENRGESTAAEAQAENRAAEQGAKDEMTAKDSSGREIATLGAGCYWCIEAVLQQVQGVEKIESGFMGGEIENPSYEEVCSGTTGHAEVVQVTFDPEELPFEHLLEWFWKLHDPTTLNRQGNDVGTQYRSVIFWHDDAQRLAARKSKEKAAPKFSSPIVTEISPATTFYKAKESHQDYYRRNKNQGYCRFVIAPKLQKLDLDH